MKFEIAKANRKCHDKNCFTEIVKGEVCGVTEEESQFGTKKVSYCKICTIRGIEVKIRLLQGQLRTLKTL
jgi:hypothetical protein